MKTISNSKIVHLLPTKLKTASRVRYWSVLFQVKRTESGDNRDTFNLKFLPRSLSLSQFPGVMFSLPPAARRDRNIGKNKLKRYEVWRCVRGVETMRI